MKNNNLSTIIMTVLVLVAVYFIASGKSGPEGAVRSVGGIQSNVATSSFRVVTAGTVNKLFSTSTSCTSRIISNQAGAIKLTFSDRIGERPTAVNGLIQTASTTVVYDAEQYGCGAIYVYPYGSDTLSLVETL